MIRQFELVARVMSGAIIRKKMEKKNRRLRKELIHINRNKAMGELSAAFAHELNQPLSSIRLNGETMLRNLSLKNLPLKESKEISKEIISSTERAEKIISNLRGMVKKEEPGFILLDINHVIEEAVNFAQKRFDNKKRKTQIKS